MRRFTARLAPIVIMAIFAASCAKSDQKSDDKAAEPAAEDGDDGDTEVSQAVPMALLDPAYIASLKEHLGPGVSSEDAYEPPLDPTKNRLELAKATLNAGARAAGQLKRVMVNMQAVLAQVFGPDGYFRGKDVVFKAGVTERLFRVDGGNGTTTAYLVVRVNDGDAEDRFGVDFFPVVDGQTLSAQATVEFTPEGGEGNARVHYVSSKPREAGGIQRLEARYKTLDAEIEATFGNVPAVPTSPARTTARLSYEAATSSVSVAGAYLWDRPSATVRADLPRYYTLTTGDVETFVMRSRLTGQAEGAQKVFFRPSGAMEPLPYTTFLASHLLKLVRDVALNEDCATAGELFRDAFEGKTVPAEVAAAPADLCATNTSYSDAQTAKLIEVGCAGGVEIPVADLPLCMLAQDGLVLSNPQLFYVADGARRLVISPETPLAEHAVVAKELESVASVSLVPLTDDFVEMRQRPVADFAQAEARPE